MKTVLIVATLCAFASLSVQAGPKKDAEGGAKKPKKEKTGAPKGPAGQFSKLDKDGSGIVSESEFIDARNGQMKERMTKAGKSEEEITQMLEKKGAGMKKQFAAKDTDGNGSLSLEEFSAKPVKAAKPEKAPKKEKTPKQDKKIIIEE